jgi:hypothetical protein
MVDVLDVSYRNTKNPSKFVMCREVIAKNIDVSAALVDSDIQLAVRVQLYSVCAKITGKVTNKRAPGENAGNCSQATLF